jgi:hypothetical protein
MCGKLVRRCRHRRCRHRQIVVIVLVFALPLIGVTNVVNSREYESVLGFGGRVEEIICVQSVYVSFFFQKKRIVLECTTISGTMWYCSNFFKTLFPNKNRRSRLGRVWKASLVGKKSVAAETPSRCPFSSPFPGTQCKSK